MRRREIASSLAIPSRILRAQAGLGVARAFLLLATLLAGASGVARASGTADEIHFTFLGETAVTFDWRGTADSISYGLTTDYGQVVVATPPPPPQPYSSPGPFWEARLTGLSPNTVYHYSIGGGPDHTFKTPIPRGTTGFTVCAQGDIGETLSYPAMGAVQSVIAGLQPDFVLALGDLTYGNAHGQARVDQHFNDVMVWSQDIAYMPSWGNHEVDPGDDLRNYKGRFDLPNPRTSPGSPAVSCCGEDWYWFDHGNVRFIAYPEPFTGAWADWFVKAGAIMDSAQADPAITFIVTFGHRPAYCTGHHPSNLTLRGYLDTLGVRHSKYVLNLNGHDHNYQRSTPQRGVIHVTAGGGGASLYPFERTGDWTAFRAVYHGTLRMKFTPAGMEGTFRCGAPNSRNDVTCVQGSVLDSFFIQAPTPPVNRPPAVSAGIDRTITLPSSVALDGTASDDGLPLPTSLGVQWAVVEGPGVVAFANDRAVDTQASFLVDGTYVLSLTVSDGEYTLSDSVRIVVNPAPPNQPPSVNAGPDRSHTLPASAMLDATVSDDGLPVPHALAIQWSAISVPAPVRFANDRSVDTPVTFTQIGSHLLALTVSDGEYTTIDSVSIEVFPAPPNQAPIVDAGPQLTITLPADANLDATVVDDGIPAFATLSWSVLEGPATVQFADARAVDTRASFTRDGTYLLKLTVNDGEFAVWDSVRVLVNPPAAFASLDVRVRAGSDDAEESGSGSVGIGSSDLEMMTDGTPQRAVGVRFTNATIPKRARITAAWLQFKVKTATSEPTALQIAGQAADHAPTFTSLNSGISTRARTAAVAWNPVPPWSVRGEAGASQRSPDLSSIVQAIVDRDGWVSGNAIAMIVTGSGTRTAHSYENDAPGATLLHVEWATTPPVNRAPSVSAGPDLAVTLPAPATLDGMVGDDGLPVPPSLTQQWSMVSGPAPVEFENALLADTRARFTVVGEYVLGLTASDGVLSASDSMRIQVNPPPPNQPPVVSAGPDRTITLPSNVTLDGTVSDDGLPLPAALTALWTAVAGPAPVQFANDQIVDAQASFTLEGTYVLSLTVSDGEYTLRDSMQVTVNPRPPNQAPVVSAGPDQTIALPFDAMLDGTVSDDGLPLPATLTLSWSAIGGPQPVTFTNDRAADTRATFPAVGTYLLSLTASDGVLSAADTASIEVIPSTAPATFEVRVRAASDDAEETTTGSMTIGSGSLEMMTDGSPQRAVGYRFTGVTIPRGARIVTAWIQFKVKAVSSVATSLSIAAHAADHASAFPKTIRALTDRPKTTPVAWNNVPAWTLKGDSGPSQRTPNLAAAVQEVVSRSGWASGNALAFIVTGSGLRSARSFEYDAAGTALLHVEWLPGPASAATIAAAAPASPDTNAAAAVNAPEFHEPAAFPVFNASIAPNPMRAAGTLRLDLRRGGPVRIELFDVRGRRVGVPRDGSELSAGRHTLRLERRAEDGSRLPTGVYFCRIQAPEGNIVLRLLALD